MKKALVLLLISALLLGACGQGGQGTDPGQADQGAIRVALGDIASVETLALFIALEHVRERGVEVEIIGQLLIAVVGMGYLFELYSRSFLMAEFWALLIVLFASAFSPRRRSRTSNARCHSMRPPVERTCIL